MNISLPTGSANSGQLESSLSAGLGASSSNDHSGSSSFETVLSESSTPSTEGKGPSEIVPPAPSASRSAPSIGKREQKGAVKTNPQPSGEKDATKPAGDNLPNSENVSTKTLPSRDSQQSEPGDEVIHLETSPEKELQPQRVIVGLDLVQGQLGTPIVAQPAIPLPQVPEGMLPGQGEVDVVKQTKAEPSASGVVSKSGAEPVVINLASTTRLEPTVITHPSRTANSISNQGRTPASVANQESSKSTPLVQDFESTELHGNVLQGEVNRQIFSTTKAETSKPNPGRSSLTTAGNLPISEGQGSESFGLEVENLFPVEPLVPTSPVGADLQSRTVPQPGIDSKSNLNLGGRVVPQAEVGSKPNPNLGVVEHLVSNPTNSLVENIELGQAAELPGNINQTQIGQLKGARGPQTVVIDPDSSREDRILRAAVEPNASIPPISTANIRSALRAEIPKHLPENTNPLVALAGKNHGPSHVAINKQPAEVKVSTVASLLVSQANASVRQGSEKVPNSSILQQPNGPLLENAKFPLLSPKQLTDSQPAESAKNVMAPVNRAVQMDSSGIRAQGPSVLGGELAANQTTESPKHFTVPANQVVQVDSPGIRAQGPSASGGEPVSIKGGVGSESFGSGLHNDQKVVVETEALIEMGLPEGRNVDQSQRSNQFSKESQPIGSSPASNSSEKTAVQQVKTRGTGDAQQVSGMTMSANDERKAEMIGQNVPVSDADGSVATIARQNLPNDEFKKVKSDFESEWSGRLREANPTNDAQLGQIDAALVEEVADVKQPQLAQEVWSAVEKFRLTEGKDWEVTIRPTHDTQIQLKLTTEGDQLVIHAKLDRGDLNVLESGWSDLQAVLAERGVQLKPLEAATGQNWSGNSNSNNSFAQSNFEGSGGNKQKQPGFEFEQNRGRADVESFFTKQAAEQKKKAQQAPLKGGRGLETWA